MAFDQESNDSISQINITPFVDVMLVLLIIFMVTAPILQQGVNVDLPQITAGPLAGKDEQLVVIVSRDGKPESESFMNVVVRGNGADTTVASYGVVLIRISPQ